MANGHRSEAMDILRKLRGDLSLTDPKLVAEVEQLDNVIEAFYHKRNDFLNLTLSGRFSRKLHLGRRSSSGLEFWPSRGFNANTSAWLAGLVNTFGIIGTVAVPLVVDCIGRIKSLIASFI